MTFLIIALACMLVLWLLIFRVVNKAAARSLLRKRYVVPQERALQVCRVGINQHSIRLLEKQRAIANLSISKQLYQQSRGGDVNDAAKEAHLNEYVFAEHRLSGLISVSPAAKRLQTQLEDIYDVALRDAERHPTLALFYAHKLNRQSTKLLKQAILAARQESPLSETLINEKFAPLLADEKQFNACLSAHFPSFKDTDAKS